MHHFDICAQHDYAGEIRRALSAVGIAKIIGISGGADDKIKGIPPDDPLQQKFVTFRDAQNQRLISEFLKVFSCGYPVALLTGGTQGGVPELATKIAKSLGMFTIGVHPKKGKKYALSADLLDLSITVGPMLGESCWGDESAAWTSLVDALIVVGGGAGTLAECAHIQKINESLIKSGQTPKYIVPIYGTGKVAEQLPHIWANPEIRNLSMPQNWIHTGGEAAKRIIEVLALDDYYDPNFNSQRA